MRTIGHAMTDAGYETITLGKWHVGKDPLQQGFRISRYQVRSLANFT
jgi:arylsulfatase A-like enzyme